MKPPDFGLTLFLYAFFFVLGELIRPKPALENAKPAGLGDFSFPTATEGRVVPILWGTCKIAGPNVVWYGDLRQDAVVEKIKTGLFSSEKVVTGYKYRVGIQFALCRGLDSIRRVWIGEDEVFSGTVTHGNTLTIDEPSLFGGDKLGNGGIVGTLRFFAGTESQSPSSYLAGRALASAVVSAAGTGYVVGEILTASGGTFSTAARFAVTVTGGGGTVAAIQLLEPGNYSVEPSNPAATTATGSGTGCTLTLTFNEPFQAEGGDTPAYRGTAYLAPATDPIYVGNSTTVKAWAFEGRRIPTGPVTGPHEVVNSADANPVNVIYEIMTNTDWGLGYDPADIDTTNFQTAGNTCGSEGNGFSFLLDNPREALDVLQEIERQIDAVVFFNQTTGKWQINLARGGYDINLAPEITPANRVELKSFSRGCWEETTNQVRVEVFDRADDYKQTYGFAIDMANVRIQGGVNISVTESHPGCKSKTLANALAWRKLRTLSYPLAKAQIVVDRTFYATQPGSIIAFTDPFHGYTKLPMRVARIDLGELEDGRITLDVVQDIFVAAVGSFGDPPATNWTPPESALVAYPSLSQLAFEAPRGFVTRDPGTVGIVDKVWAGARRTGPEVSFVLRERHSSGTPSGAYADAAESFGFLLIGQLASTLNAGTAYPTASITVVPTPDSQAAVEAGILDGASLSDLGSELVNLILVGEEFMLVSTAQTSGANVAIQNVYRGVLDSVQATHAAGTRVYLIAVGGVLSDTVFTPLHNVDLKLLPRSVTATLSESLATTIQITMANRVRRPYPPSSVSLGGTAFASTASLEGTGSGESLGILSALIRRDLRTTDEIAALTVDAPSLFSDFPTANGTTHEIDVRNDPAGANTLLFTQTLSGASATVRRLDILKATDGVLPTRLRYTIRALHTYEGTSYASRQELTWDFNVTTGLSGQFNFGSLDTNDVSNLYTATAAGTHNFTLSTSFTAGAVEYRLNGGSWTNLITAGSTSGSIAGVLVSDTIEVRHLSSDVGALKFLSMDAPGAGQDAYAILFV